MTKNSIVDTIQKNDIYIIFFLLILLCFSVWFNIFHIIKSKDS